MRRQEDREQWLDHGVGCLTILPYYSFTYFLLLPPAGHPLCLAMPPKRNRPLKTQEAERMERARRWKELAPSIRDSPHIEAQSLLSLMEKGKLQSGECSSGYWDEFLFFMIIFLFVFFFFFLLYNSLPWNKNFQMIRINVIRRGFGPIFHGNQTNSKIAKENSI
jgi:hypothetical protein